MVWSIASQSRAVSSIRVPVRPRRWSFIWPLSTEGKKSWPSHGKSRTSEATQAPKKTTAKSPRRRRQAARRLRYPSRTASKRSSKERWKRARRWPAGAR